MDLEKRMASLEKRVRLYKRLGLLAVILLAGFLIAGAAASTPKVVEAEKFVLKDARGKQYAVWSVNKGKPIFVMTDGIGPRLSLSVEKKSAAILLLDVMGTPRLSAGVSVDRLKQEVSEMSVFDAGGNPKLVLSAKLGGKLTLFDSSGSGRATLGISEGGEPALWLKNKKGGVIWSALPESK